MVWYGIPCSAGVWYVFRVWQDIPGYVTGYGMGYVQGDTLRMVWDTVYTPTSLYRQVVRGKAPHIPYHTPIPFIGGRGEEGGEGGERKGDHDLGIAIEQRDSAVAESGSPSQHCHAESASPSTIVRTARLFVYEKVILTFVCVHCSEKVIITFIRLTKTIILQCSERLRGTLSPCAFPRGFSSWTSFCLWQFFLPLPQETSYAHFRHSLADKHEPFLHRAKSRFVCLGNDGFVVLDPNVWIFSSSFYSPSA